MKKIKAFVDKKRTDARFKRAGEGRSLADGTDADAESNHPIPPQQTQHTQPGDKRPERKEPSAAALAAMARIDANKPKTITPRVFSNAASGKVDDDEVIALKMQANLMQKARKDREAKARAATASSSQVTTPVVEPEQKTRSSPLKYICPICETSFDEAAAKENLIQCLRDQIPSDPVRYSATLINSACTDEAKKALCIKTISKYIENAVLHPEEEKFRRIRLGNPAFQERVVGVPGGLEFVQAIKFVEAQVDGEAFLALSDEALIDLIEHHEEYTTSLLGSPTMRCSLDRDIKVINPLKLPSGMDMKLPDKFYEVDKADLKVLAMQAKGAVDDNLTLRTSAMRNEKKLNAIKSYKYALVRVRIKNDQIWQGTFKANETVGDVMRVLADSLEPTSFSLHHAGGTELKDNNMTLRDAGIAPSALLNIKTDVPGSVTLLKSLTYL